MGLHSKNNARDGLPLAAEGPGDVVRSAYIHTAEGEVIEGKKVVIPRPVVEMRGVAESAPAPDGTTDPTRRQDVSEGVPPALRPVRGLKEKHPESPLRLGSEFLQVIAELIDFLGVVCLAVARLFRGWMPPLHWLFAQLGDVVRGAAKSWDAHAIAMDPEVHRVVGNYERDSKASKEIHQNVIANNLLQRAIFFALLIALTLYVFGIIDSSRTAALERQNSRFEQQEGVLNDFAAGIPRTSNALKNLVMDKVVLTGMWIDQQRRITDIASFDAGVRGCIAGYLTGPSVGVSIESASRISAAWSEYVQVVNSLVPIELASTNTESTPVPHHDLRIAIEGIRAAVPENQVAADLLHEWAIQYRNDAVLLFALAQDRARRRLHWQQANANWQSDEHFIALCSRVEARFGSIKSSQHSALIRDRVNRLQQLLDAMTTLDQRSPKAVTQATRVLVTVSASLRQQSRSGNGMVTDSSSESGTKRKSRAKPEDTFIGSHDVGNEELDSLRGRWSKEFVAAVESLDVRPEKAISSETAMSVLLILQKGVDVTYLEIVELMSAELKKSEPTKPLWERIWNVIAPA